MDLRCDRMGGRRILLVFAGFICGNDLFDILKRQPQLLGIELLRTSAKLRTLQLAQKMAQPIILRKCLVALGNRSITLGPRCHEERLQRVDIHRQPSAVSLTTELDQIRALM